MSVLHLVWRNIWYKPLRSIFNILLISISVALIIILLLINKQFGNHLGKESEGIDLILCAKGSPLQSVLCNIFQIDAPTGNIPIDQVKVFLNPSHPLIQKAIPFALGDSYRNNRIVGTTLDYFEWKKIDCQEGKLFSKNSELVIGAELAHKENISIGSVLTSNHGLIDLEGEMTHQHELTVIGILKKQNSIDDHLIFSPISTYWEAHESDHDHKDLDSDSSLHHQHSVLTNEELLLYPDHEITSVLIQFKGTNVQTLNFGRKINENSKIMAVNPPIEISRLYELTHSASNLLFWIAIILGIMSLFALIINLIQTMEERKFELAIMRISGASRLLIFIILILEALFICLIGFIIAFTLGHGILHIASTFFNLGNQYGIFGLVFYNDEFLLLILVLLCGVISAFIPGVRVFRQDIAETIKRN